MTTYLAKVLILGAAVTAVEALSWPPVAVAALVAVGWLFTRTRRVFVVIEAAATVINRELQHNGGNSIKDDVANVLRVQHVHGQRLDALERRLPEERNT